MSRPDVIVAPRTGTIHRVAANTLGGTELTFGPANIPWWDDGIPPGSTTIVTVSCRDAHSTSQMGHEGLKYRDDCNPPKADIVLRPPGWRCMFAILVTEEYDHVR
jgi:hypothetical protein